MQSTLKKRNFMLILGVVSMLFAGLVIDGFGDVIIDWAVGWFD